jgi:hypothetical protein
MAITLPGVVAYVNENNLSLIKKTVLGAKTASLLPIQTGIKSAETLNLLDSTVVFADGTTCGFTDAGTSVISQRKLTVGAIKVNKSYCPATLEEYFTQTAITAGAGSESLGELEVQFIDGNLNAINAATEKAIWQGDTNSGDDNLDNFDGFLKIIAATTGYTHTTGATITASNVVAMVNEVYNAIPVEILDKEDTVIFVGSDIARLYTQALTALNLFNYTGTELIVLGTNVKVIAVNGLNSTGKMVAGQLSNMIIGTDLQNDQEQVNFRYVDSADAFWFTVKFKLGVQVAYPEFIVLHTTN